MAAVTQPTNLGEIRDTGSTEALYLKIAAGMVLTTFEETNVTLSRINARPMPAGAKSLQFPAVGSAYSKRHEVGKNILQDNADAANDTPSDRGVAAPFLSNIHMGEREVFIDDPLESSAFVDEWEQVKASFESMGPISEELGRVLAVDNDKLVMRQIVGATDFDWDASGNLPDEHIPANAGQNKITDANAGTDASALLDSIRQIAEKFDEAVTEKTGFVQEIPQADRFVALKPTHYNLLVQNQDLLNRDFGGENGIFSDGTVFKAWGMTLLKSNHVPTDDFSSDGSQGIRSSLGYNFDCQNTIAVCWQRQAIAGVRAGSVSMSKQYLLHYGGDLLVAKLATGYDVLRPLGVGYIATA